MDELASGGSETGGVRVPVEVGGQVVYVLAEMLGGEETEISSRRPSLEQALDGLTGVVTALVSRLSATNATKATVEFGCEFGLEAGNFVPIIGKVSAKSTLKVGLEWTMPTP